jgi:hypothetical protein
LRCVDASATQSDRCDSEVKNMAGSNPLLAALFASVTLTACAGDGTDSSRLDSRDETLDSVDSDTTPLEDEDTSTPWESQLPFHIERAPEGEPLTADEIDETTDAVATMWRDTGYFQWLLDTSHGMAAGNEWGYPDYKAWWQDTIAVKSGDTVTFRHVGGGDNNLLRHARVLLYALAGHLATGDTRLKEIAIPYMRGVQAMFTAMVWQHEDPPIDTIMARAVFNHDHAYLTSDGRKVAVDYGPVKLEEIARRHDTIHNPANPTWGDIWVRTKRSKDDLPFLYRDVPVLMRTIAESPDPEMVAEATRTLAYIRGFSKDVVDHNYRIRTKGPDGEVYEPFYNGFPDEFACYTAYDELDPTVECNAKLSTALIAYHDTLDNDCEDGVGVYEHFAVIKHYWNTPILIYAHVSALALALLEGEDDVAFSLAAGVEQRVDKYMNDQETRVTVGTWDGDATTFLIASASYGFPLTAREARFVSDQLRRASAHYRAYPRWDLWDDSVADGEYDYIPGDWVAGEVVDGQTNTFQPAEIAALLEYCESPYKDPLSSPFVDCEALLDTRGW